MYSLICLGKLKHRFFFYFLSSFFSLAIRFQVNNAYSMACRHLLTIQEVIEILQGKGEKKPQTLPAIPLKSYQKFCRKGEAGE